MYKFKFNDVEYNFPDCWDDILVEDFIKILKLEKQKSLYQYDELYIYNNGIQEQFIDFMSSIEQQARETRNQPALFRVPDELHREL